MGFLTLQSPFKLVFCLKNATVYSVQLVELPSVAKQPYGNLTLNSCATGSKL